MDTHASETAIFEQLDKNLPPVFSREEAARQMGGAGQGQNPFKP